MCVGVAPHLAGGALGAGGVGSAHETDAGADGARSATHDVGVSGVFDGLDDSMAAGAPEGLGGSEDLDLMYDPMLNCYYDPKTNKYYELRDP